MTGYNFLTSEKDLLRGVLRTLGDSLLNLGRFSREPWKVQRRTLEGSQAENALSISYKWNV